MKPRIQIDSFLGVVLSIAVIATFFFPALHQVPPLAKDFLYLFGMTFILKGIIIRMAARGHKKTHSKQSDSLVTTGPYSLIRNPMYLGTYMVGAGFVLIIGAWWMWPIYTLVFYLRFRIQIGKEEKYLTEIFGDTYRRYCQSVPCFIPRISQAFKVKMRDIFNPKEAFDTKEANGLWTWPLVAIVFAVAKEIFVFHNTDITRIIIVLLAAILLVAVGSFIKYQIK